jgi:hypothetical protein
LTVDPDQAIAEARAEAQELAADSFWGAAYVGATARQAVLVQNLTPGGSHYFLIDFQKNNRSTGRMVVNRDTGIVDIAAGIEDEGDELPKFIDPTDVHDRITPEVTLADGRKVRTPTEEPTIVVLWQHCRESQTMLQPFYWLRWLASGLFLRVDGEFFDRLTPTDGMPDRVA